MMKTILAVLAIFLFGSLSIGDFKILLRKMTTKYTEPNLFLKLKVTQESLTDTSTSTITIKRDRSSYFISDGNSTSILKNNKYLVVNDVAKAMSYEELGINEENPKDVFQDLSVLVDSLNIDSFSIIKSEANSERYIVWSKNVQYIFNYNKTDGLISSYEVKLYLGTQKKKVIERTIIDYVDQRWNVSFSSTDFPIEKYIIKEGSKIKQTNAYKNYEIIE